MLGFHRILPRGAAGKPMMNDTSHSGFSRRSGGLAAVRLWCLIGLFSGFAPQIARAEPSAKAASGAPASAEGQATDDKSPRNFSHHRLGSFAVSAGSGFQMVVPYSDGQFCGQFSTDPAGLDGTSGGRKALCTAGAPWFLDFTMGYGVLPRLDVVLTLRVNVSKRAWRCRDDGDPESCRGLFNDKVGIGLLPGVRAWLSKPERMFKIGAAVDFVWIYEDFAGYRQRPTCSGTEDAEVICPLGREGQVVAAEGDVGNNDVGLRFGPVLQLDPHRNVGVFLLPSARMSFLRWFEAGFDIQLGVQARFP